MQLRNWKCDLQRTELSTVLVRKLLASLFCVVFGLGRAVPNELQNEQECPTRAMAASAGDACPIKVDAICSSDLGDALHIVLASAFQRWTNDHSLPCLPGGPTARPSDTQVREARDTLKLCVQNQHPAASFLLAVVDATYPEMGGKAKSAIREEFETAAKAGISIANLGSASMSYELNDSDRASRALRALQAANEEYTSELIGMMLSEGMLFSKSTSHALPWLREAATEHGSAIAQRKLVNIYLEGDGVAADPREAEKWFDMLAANPAAVRDFRAEEEIMNRVQPNSK